MPNDANPVTGTTQEPFQYGVLGLFLLVFSVALGLAALTPDGKNWFEAALTTLLFWILLGLGHQVRDLWRTYHGRNDLDVERRWGWWFALGWRVAVIVVLAGSWLVIIVEEHRRFGVSRESFFVEQTDEWFELQRLPWGNWPAVYFPLWIVLASVPRRSRTRIASRWRWFVEGLGWLAILVLCLFSLADTMLMPFLVHLTIVGIFMAQPNWLSVDWLRSVDMARIPFCAASALAACLFPINLLLVRQLSRRWDRGGGARWSWGALLACGLAVSAGYAVWMLTVGLPSLSPLIAETFGRRSWDQYVVGLVLLVFLVTAVAYRMVGATDRHECASVPSWRCHPARYYHERSVVLAPLIALLATHLVVLLYPEIRRFGLRELYALFAPKDCLPLLVLLTAIASLWAIWRRPTDRAADDPPALQPYRFLAVWLALSATLLLGIPALAATGFAVWLLPW